ncbi:DNA topoisomerase 2-binding protein 1-B-like [Phlebotomus argentipes]|uniref:DNA topoisomerase 2-binding protein 1-B-like n=1 Tax=Phlebotomus argentipes TaxID=94469 RepID=UPI0028936175|nr:DNA topoisomerase 2-binding protein 1-B-like [Phlebotomus argentipes]
MNISLQGDSLSFFCVLRNGCRKEEAPSLLSCVEHIREHLNLSNNLKWVDEDYCLRVDVESLAKTSVFIFEEFSGRAFEHLTSNSKALIIGPPCLKYSLVQNTIIPLSATPVFTVAMKNLVVSLSGISVAEKAEIKKLVHWMGGCYSNNLDASCTHLVTDTVKSKKYEIAGTRGLEIFRPEWVKDIWDKNQERAILAEEPIFNRHRLPVFHKLVVTSTNLSNTEKENIKRLIEENGGTYSRTFKSQIVNILILNEDGTHSEKYKLSGKLKIECLKPQWVYDSTAKKYAVCMENYRVIASVKHSTPTKDLGNRAHFSMMSNISQISSVTTADKEIDETQHGVTPRASCSKTRDEDVTLKGWNHTRFTTKLDTPNQEDTFNYRDKLKNLQLKVMKASGTFLDGLQIYLLGFTAAESMKLKKIIIQAGATLYTELSDNISHVICGEATENEIKRLGMAKIQCKIVTLDWLLESHRLKHPAEEEKYMMLVKRVPPESEQPSPASKKSIEAMNASFKRPAVPRRILDLGEGPSKVIQKYLPTAETTNSSLTSVSQHNNNATNETYNSNVDPQDVEMLTFLEDTTFYLYGYEDENPQAVKDVENALGIVVDATFKGTVDYILVPVEALEKIDPPVKGTNIVNDLWLEDSISNRNCVHIMFYHEPILSTGLKDLLLGIHITFSNFTGSIKLYMAALAAAMGAKILDHYPKKVNSLLICAKTEGSKYAAALKWKFPVVTDDWLFDTYSEKRVKKIGNYLLGKSTVPEGVEPYQRLNREEEAEILSVQENVDPVENDAFLGDLTTEGDGYISRATKRKSDELDCDNYSPLRTKFAVHTNKLVESPIRHKRLALLAQETPTNKKTSNTPITSQVNNTYSDFDTPVRGTIRDTLKLNLNVGEQKTPGGSIRIPDTSVFLKKPNTPLVPEPSGDLTQLWSVQRNADAATSLIPEKSTPNRDSPSASDVRNYFYQTLLGENHYEAAKRLETQSQSQSQTPVERGIASGEEMESVRKLKEFLENNMSSSHRRLIFAENSEPCTEPPCTGPQGGSEQLVGWVDPSEYQPFRNPDMEESVKEYNFHICGITKKAEIMQMIEKLGGKVLISETFDPTCTHVVFGNLNRGEKVLCAVATGKWLLNTKYLQDSTKAGHFLPEEDYEVGNDELQYCSQLKEIEKPLAQACFRWRQRIKRAGNAIEGPFKNMRCLLLIGNMTDPISRLITAGCGTIVRVDPPYSTKAEAKSLTHVLVNTKDHNISRADVRFFKSKHIPIVSVRLVNAQLCDEIAPNLNDFLI